MSYKVLGVLVFVSVLFQVQSLHTCNSKISDFVMKNNNSPNNPILVLSQRIWNYVVLPASDIPKGAKCLKQFFDPPYDNCKSARIITYYQNSSKSQWVEDCEVDDLGNGHLLERKSNNRTLHIYLARFSNLVFGYYRCGTSDTNGYDQAACMISCGTEVSKVSADVQKCQSFFKNAGVNGLVTVNVCHSLIK